MANVEGSSSPLVGKNIIQLGIQGPSGLHFQLDGNSTAELIIGSTGVYELDVNGMTVIKSITFPQFSTNTPPTDQIIIDIIYWEGGQ